MKASVGLFFALQTQWRWTSAGMAGALRMGIDYNAIEPTARMLRVELTDDVFDDLRVMEGEALVVWARKRL
jgi:hypothetical protein